MAIPDPKAMHSLHYLPTLDPDSGGVRSYVLDLLELLNRAGHDTTLVTPEPFGHASRPGDAERGAHHLVTLDGRPDLIGRFKQPAIESVFDRLPSPPDLLHLHGMWSTPNLQLADEGHRRGIPHLVTIHGMLDTWCMQKSTLRKKAFLKLGGRRWLHEAACIISTAEGEVDQTRQYFPETPVEIIPAPMDLSEYQVLPGPGLAEEALAEHLDDGLPTVLFLSRIHPKKGLEVLIDASGILRDRGRPVRTIVAGGPEGPYRQAMEGRVRRLGLEECVRFVGPVAGETKRSLFQRADVFALATHQENFGIVFTESLACETPVITTRGVDIWPELEASGGASIVERTPESFADAIAGIVETEGRSADMGGSGRRWVMDYLDVDRITARFLEVYGSVAESRGATAS